MNFLNGFVLYIPKNGHFTEKLISTVKNQYKGLVKL